MKRAYSVLLLASLLRAASCLLVKSGTIIGSMSWVDAQTACRKSFVDLISFQSYNDSADIITLMGIVKLNRVWIGLNKPSASLVFTQWSDGSPVSYTNWQSQPNVNKDCVILLQTGFWSTFECTEILSFVCYKWEPQIILVHQLMTWNEALTYCRRNYHDLVSLSTQMDFFVANNVSKQLTNVWTGLRFMAGSWFWVNGEPVESPVDLPSCPAMPFQCGALVPGTEILENRDCMEKMYFLCYFP